MNFANMVNCLLKGHSKRLLVIIKVSLLFVETVIMDLLTVPLSSFVNM